MIQQVPNIQWNIFSLTIFVKNVKMPRVKLLQFSKEMKQFI